jgi:hypothetical protein
MKRLNNLDEFAQVLDDAEIERFLEIVRKTKNSRGSEIIEFLLELQDRHEFAITHTTFGDWDNMPERIAARIRERKLKRLGI